MSSVIKIKRRIGGTQQAPTGTNNEGELALYFPGAAGATTKPTLYANDGGGWREVNPNVNPNVRGIVSTANAGAVEAAFNAQNITVAAGDIVIYTHPSSNGTAYVYTGPAGAPVSGATATQFTALGAAPAVATGAQVIAGTDNAHTVTPKALRDANLAAPSGTPANDANHLVRLATGGKLDTGFLNLATGAQILTGTVETVVNTPKAMADAATNTPNATPANDANKYVRLGATGKIAGGFLALPATMSYKGNMDVTVAYAAPSPAWIAGDFGLISKSGAADASWNAQGVTGAVKQGDMIFYDGTKYHVMAAETDLNAYVPKAGGTMVAAAKIAWPGTAAAEAGKTLLDLRGGTIDNGLIDGGTF